MMVLLDLKDNLYEIGAEDREEPRYYPAPWCPSLLLPSVTTVIGVVRNPFLLKWRGRVGNDEADRVTGVTATYGEAIHDFTAIMDMVSSGVEVIGTPPPDMGKQLSSYLLWRDAHVADVIEVEMAVYSKRWMYAGRLDRVFMLKGDTLPSVWDIKTGTLRSISRAQTAAYAGAYEEMTGRKVGRRGLIGVSRAKGTVSVKEHTGATDFQGFLSLLNTYRWLESVGEV